MEPHHTDETPWEDEDVLPEKNAKLIMGTNNSSIVSKRSVERLYLPKPHFYHHFVKKPQRRAPTINRGYWLRMRAVDWVVRKFLERPSEQPKVIINLGCGYDPIPFQWLTIEPQLCDNVKFVDVDYDALMESKRDIVLNTPELKNLLTRRTHPSSNPGVIFHSDQYSILGCDLKNLRRLRELVRCVVDVEKCLVLCVAEVSITYMATVDADAVLAWCTTLSPDVTFCLLEQRSPDVDDNPFTATMMKHFEKLGTPLRSLMTYPGEHAITQRFMAAGYTELDIFSLWELWADPRFLSPSQRMALDYVEPFDEWEEFALFASHYGLVIAQTGPDNLIPPPPLERRHSEASNLSDVSARTASPYRAEQEWYAYDYSENTDNQGRTHHASAYLSPSEDVISIHGGIGPQGRQSSTCVYAPAGVSDIHPVAPPLEIQPRSCHTISTMQNRQNMLVGGRASPSVPFRDCWLQTGDKWERVHDLPEPRYRHRTLPIILPDGSHGVVVFGGKVSATKVATDYLLWSPRDGWQRLRSLDQDPIPRFGATFVRLGYNHGLMLGGMRQDGVICQGLWRWRLIVRSNVVQGIKFRTSTALDASVGMYPWLGRMGASYSIIRNELLLIGGIARLGCIPKVYEIMSIMGSFSAFADNEKEMDLRVICVSPKLPEGAPRPFLVGHSTHRTVNETTLIIGGGCTCFSFGSRWNTGAWTIYFFHQGILAPWSLVKPRLIVSAQPKIEAASIPKTDVDHAPTATSVSLVAIDISSDLDALVLASKPAMITSLDIGPCTNIWTPSYLKSRTAPTRKAVIHSAPTPIMNFLRRDTFNYNTLPFHSFLSIITSSSPEIQPHMYLRSISTSSPNSTPANLEIDFPEIASDFILPPQLSYIKDRLHSSPLRISTNVSMWLHYDVMANILFHISSHPNSSPKKLILFPPDDIHHLSFSPGCTTSTLDVFTEDSPDPVYPPHTHPHTVLLNPGEALFIPPLWAHTAAASPPGIVNISVNVFFRSLPDAVYPAGRDVYGNRDLQAYEDGRRDVEKIVRRFKVKAARKAAAGDVANGKIANGDNRKDTSVPRDLAKAYLERLGRELLEKAQAL